jgi:hypothetical protein
MNNQRQYLFVVLLVLLFIASVLSAYYLFFMKPVGEKLNWVSSMYTQCLTSSMDVEPGNLYSDLQDVIQGKYNSEKLRFYANNIKQYSESNCEKADAVTCEDSYLYVLRSNLARGNEKDLKISFAMLDQYKAMQGINIYYDALFLDISLYYGWKNELGERFYKSLIDQTKNHHATENYFKKPHQEELCDIHLNYIGMAFSKSGDYTADLYIQYHVKN